MLTWIRYRLLDFCEVMTSFVAVILFWIPAYFALWNFLPLGFIILAHVAVGIIFSCLTDIDNATRK